jgi:hypothetical protein
MLSWSCVAAEAMTLPPVFLAGIASEATFPNDAEHQHGLVLLRACKTLLQVQDQLHNR